jgi:putative membrane protein
MSHLVQWAIRVLVSAVSVLIVAKVLPGIKVKSFGSAIVFAIILGLFNAIAWGIFAPLTVTFSVLTLGAGILVVNGLVFLMAGKVSGVQVSGCVMAAIGSLCVTFVNGLLHQILH